MASPQIGDFFPEIGSQNYDLEKKRRLCYNHLCERRNPARASTANIARWKYENKGESEMRYKQFGNTYLVRIDLGEEIIEQLKKLCVAEKVRLGRVEAIGATDQAVIGVYDLETKAYHPEKINEFMEITSLNGNITAMDGKPYIHLHATLADQRHTIHGGHVLEMRVGATCEMFITVFDGEVSRKQDKELGINLWTF